MALRVRQNYKPKAKHDILPLEIITTKDRYAFTYNPCDKYQHFGAINRLKLCIDDLSICIVFASNIYKIEVWPELSSKGRFHIHGFIRIMDPIIFYTYSAPALMTKGTVVIKEIADYDGWQQYCNKQFEFHEYCRLKLCYIIPMIIGEEISKEATE